MKKVLALLATLGALTFASVAGAGIVDEATSTAGTDETAVVTLTSQAHLTTAFAVGVWSSAEVAGPVHVNYAVNCGNPGNDKSGSFDLLAGRFVSDAAYIWIGSPNIAAPWYGWDHCVATVTLSQFASSNDIALVGWLASHS